MNEGSDLPCPGRMDRDRRPCNACKSTEAALSDFPETWRRARGGKADAHDAPTHDEASCPSGASSPWSLARRHVWCQRWGFARRGSWTFWRPENQNRWSVFLKPIGHWSWIFPFPFIFSLCNVATRDSPGACATLRRRTSTTELYGGIPPADLPTSQLSVTLRWAVGLPGSRRKSH